MCVRGGVFVVVCRGELRVGFLCGAHGLSCDI
jgi:hypothetical protein